MPGGLDNRNYQPPSAAAAFPEGRRWTPNPLLGVPIPLGGRFLGKRPVLLCGPTGKSAGLVLGSLLASGRGFSVGSFARPGYFARPTANRASNFKCSNRSRSARCLWCWFLGGVVWGFGGLTFRP